MKSRRHQSMVVLFVLALLASLLALPSTAIASSIYDSKIAQTDGVLEIGRYGATKVDIALCWREAFEWKVENQGTTSQQTMWENAKIADEGWLVQEGNDQTQIRVTVFDPSATITFDHTSGSTYYAQPSTGSSFSWVISSYSYSGLWDCDASHTDPSLYGSLGSLINFATPGDVYSDLGWDYYGYGGVAESYLFIKGAVTYPTGYDGDYIPDTEPSLPTTPYTGTVDCGGEDPLLMNIYQVGNNGAATLTPESLGRADWSYDLAAGGYSITVNCGGTLASSYAPVYPTTGTDWVCDVYGEAPHYCVLS